MNALDSSSYFPLLPPSSIESKPDTNEPTKDSEELKNDPKEGKIEMGDFQYIPPEVTAMILGGSGPHEREVCSLWRHIDISYDPCLIKEALNENKFSYALALSNQKLKTTEIPELIIYINSMLSFSNKTEKIILLQIADKLIPQIPKNHHFDDSSNFFPLLYYAATSGKSDLICKMDNFPVFCSVEEKNKLDAEKIDDLLKKQYRTERVTVVRNWYEKNVKYDAHYLFNAGDLEETMKKWESQREEQLYFNSVSAFHKDTKSLIKTILSTSSSSWRKKAIERLYGDDKIKLLPYATEYPELLQVIVNSLANLNPQYLFDLHKLKQHDLIPSELKQRFTPGLFPILEACSMKEFEKTKTLLETFVNSTEDLQELENSVEWITSYACYYGDIECFHFLKEKELLTAQHESVGFIEACEGGQVDIMRELLVDPNLDIESYGEPVEACIHNGHIECAKLLIRSRPNLDLAGSLTASAQEGHLEMYQYIAGICRQDISQLVTLLMRQPHNLSGKAHIIAHYLFNHQDFTIDEISLEYINNCMYCCQFGYTEMLKELLNLRLPVSISSLTYAAITFNRYEILDFLLIKFPKSLIVEHFKYSIEIGYSTFVKRFLEDPRICAYLNSEPNNPNGLSPKKELMILASESESLEIANLLLAAFEANSDAPSTSKNKRTLEKTEDIDAPEEKYRKTEQFLDDEQELQLLGDEEQAFFS